MYLIGFDIGSSSVKASLLDAETGKLVKSAFYPKTEMPISALKPDWAEQDPEQWWTSLKLACNDVMQGVSGTKVMAIGISYQMHGLVMVDKNQKILRPSIIWCDSRAVPYGEKAFKEIGAETCLSSLLNSPGNFTASKLKWVKENEPETFSKIYKIMLPGDFIAMKLSGEINTTVTGLSEGIFWDYSKSEKAGFLLEYYGFDESLLPNTVPVFSVQGNLLPEVAESLGLKAGIPIAYRAGDQPNNAFSLNVLNPGEIAATAGTSGVVYGISEEIKYDPQSRVNTFIHVNNSPEKPRLGVLLCVNGTGILNAWLKHNISSEASYEDINKMTQTISPGSEGLGILPFGNGAERMLGNIDPGCEIFGLNFNRHNKNHIFRAAHEGVAFAFHYGMEIMKNIGIDPSVIKAGNANMFLSPVFRETLSGITGATIELFDTDGSQGAARGAGVGCGFYKEFNEAFNGLRKINEISPDRSKNSMYEEAWNKWSEKLLKTIKS
jgi:xylulokinase